MEKKTAVEWLQERISIGLTYEQEVLFEGLFDQAKEMEKEQMHAEYMRGWRDGYSCKSIKKELLRKQQKKE